MGFRNNAESATEFRNSCPPPSSMLPSITSGGIMDAITKCAREYPQVDGIYRTLAGVEIVITSHPHPDPALPFHITTIASSPRSTRH
jgi:hypothetical protein